MDVSCNIPLNQSNDSVRCDVSCNLWNELKLKWRSKLDDLESPGFFEVICDFPNGKSIIVESISKMRAKFDSETLSSTRTCL